MARTKCDHIFLLNFKTPFLNYGGVLLIPDLILGVNSKGGSERKVFVKLARIREDFWRLREDFGGFSEELGRIRED